MSVDIRVEGANWTDASFRQIMAVPEGAEALFIEGGALSQSVRNRVSDKPAATAIGNPVINLNSVTLTNADKLQTGMADGVGLAIFAVVRPPTSGVSYIASTTSGPSLLYPPNTTNGFSLFRNSDGSMRMTGAYRNPDLGTVALVQAILTGGDAPPANAWTLLCGKVVEEGPTITDWTRNKTATNAPSAGFLRDPTTRTVMMGGNYNTTVFDGMEVAAWAAYSIVPNTYQEGLIAAQLRAIVALRGITV